MPIIGAPAGLVGGSAVPTDGTFANANWVEALYTDHDYSGRTILTNGLLLLDFSIAQTRLARCYVWNTALSTAAWQQFADLVYFDNSSNSGTLQSITPVRIGAEESALIAIASTSGGQAAQFTFRLQRGRYEGRVDFKPLTQATTISQSLLLALPATYKLSYNSGAVSDNVLSETACAVPTDYGYGAAFIASATYPFIAGFHTVNQPGGSLPGSSFNSANLGLGDTTSLAAGAQRSYGFFALPYGVSGTYSTANLQAEAESGTLGTGWTNIVDAVASGGHTANLASGTASTNADLWGTAFVPALGVYDLWVRMKATTATSSTAQLKIGLWDTTLSAYVTSASTTYAPDGVTTSYAWYRVAAGVTPIAGDSMQVRAVTTATTDDAWQIDESALVPHSLTVANNGPQDLWEQFMFDRSTRLVRP